MGTITVTDDTGKAISSEANLLRPELKEFYFLDETDKELTLAASGLNDNVYFGQKVKIKIVTKDIVDDKEIFVELTAKANGTNVALTDGKTKFILKVKSNEAISDPIYLHPKWYNEEMEYYDYTVHETKMDPSEAITFMFNATLVHKPKIKATEQPTGNASRLKPATSYRRNYEELVGLFKVGTKSVTKDKKDNYENKFINYNTTITTIVKDFIDKITKEGVAKKEIETLITGDVKTKTESVAKKLWDAAVAQVQSGNLDDRPLYWARNKMQVWLKRSLFYKGDIDFANSIVNGAGLKDLITIFEEKSRNYTGIDFSGAKADPVKVAKAESELKVAEDKLTKIESDKRFAETELIDAENLPKKTTDQKVVRDKAIKKAQAKLRSLNTTFAVDKNAAEQEIKTAQENLNKANRVIKALITGFDPFQLNPDSQFNTSMGPDSAETFNPSGIIALALNRNLSLIAENIYIQTCIFPVRYEDFDKGVVEDVLKKHFKDVDLIMTTSLNGGDPTFDVEKYAIEYRGGFHDNMCIGDYGNPQYDKSRFKANTSNKLIETTLPQDKIFGSLSTLGIILNGHNVRFDTSSTATKGSGSNYLSNEVMYRATKLRGSSTKPVGHFHLGNLKYITKAVEVKNVVYEIIKKIVI